MFVYLARGHLACGWDLWEMRSMLFFEDPNWLSLGDWLVGSATVLFKTSLSDGWDGVLIPVSLLMDLRRSCSTFSS